MRNGGRSPKIQRKQWHICILCVYVRLCVRVCVCSLESEMNSLSVYENGMCLLTGIFINWVFHHFIMW